MSSITEESAQTLLLVSVAGGRVRDRVHWIPVRRFIGKCLVQLVILLSQIAEESSPSKPASLVVSVLRAVEHKETPGKETSTAEDQIGM